MFNKKELCKFLVEAKKSTYASGDATKEIKEENKSKTKQHETKQHYPYRMWLRGFISQHRCSIRV